MMSLAVSSIGKVSPRPIRPKPSTPLVCSKLQDNGERSSQITKSTTLFPMRICDKPGTMQYSDKNIQVCNNFQTFSPKINNLSNTLSDKKELHIDGSKTNAQKYNGNEPKNSSNFLNQYYGQNLLNISGKFNTSDEKEKVKNEIAKLRQCFTCYKIIKEEEFCKHLFFGRVKCIVCNAVFRDCQSFQVSTAEFALGNVLCKHMFHYCRDPVQRLTENLLGGNINDDSFDEVFAKSLIKIYIDKLKSLEMYHPWEQAIASCREYVDGNESRKRNDYIALSEHSISSQSSLFRKSSDCIAHSEHGISNQSSLLRKSSDYIAHSEQGISSQSSLPSENREDDYHGIMKRKKCLEDDYHGIIKRKKCTEVVLSQDYDISLLEKTTEFVKVLEPLQESLTSPEKEKKIEKTRQESPERQDLSDEESIEFVPIPSDGFYYVSVKPIEECPNCYEVLCPSRFTVNVENFLMTVVCEGCSLTIYITSAAPELQIITDDAVNHKASLSNKENDKEYRPKITKKTQGKGHKHKKIKKRSLLLH